MPDSLVILSFSMLGLSILGLGFYMGTNKERARWRQWLREVSK